jgi:hypothetical protein
MKRPAPRSDIARALERLAKAAEEIARKLPEPLKPLVLETCGTCAHFIDCPRPMPMGGPRLNTRACPEFKPLP